MKAYWMCRTCVMDTTDPDISFDEQGVCCYCRRFAEHPAGYGKYEDGLAQWESRILPEVKQHGRGRQFDAVVGVSGGIDSSYLSYVCSTFGLRCLLVHADNRFDTETAKRNMKRISEYTGYPLHFYSADFEEFRSVQVAYLRASVIDMDIPSDYLDEAFVRKAAVDHKVKYVFSGGNYFSDAFMPYAWTYRNKNDWTNLRNINRKFGWKSLNSFPINGILQIIYNRNVRKIHYLTPLNYLGYNRFEALKILQEKVGYEAYGDKHDENVLTRFYQRYILPTKFGIEKRKMNYSNFIRAKGMTREQALQELKKPTYDPAQLEADWKFVLGNLEMNEEEFERCMSLPTHAHEEYGTDAWLYVIAEFLSRWKKRVDRNIRKVVK